MKTVFIYALCEPGTRTVRYIGKTGNLKRRLKQHIKVSSKFISPLGEWLRGLSGALPNIIVLCETSSLFWQDDETREIRAARALGAKLVNSSDGGEGGLNPSPELRKKMGDRQRGEKNHMFGKHPSLETRAAISATLKGVPKSPEFCAALSARQTGVPKSLETRAAISAAKMGVPLSPETCAAMSAARKGVPRGPFSPEHCAAISAAKTGVSLSPETCAAMSAASKGVPKSPEHRASISAGKTGLPWSPARRAAFERKKAALNFL